MLDYMHTAVAEDTPGVEGLPGMSSLHEDRFVCSSSTSFGLLHGDGDGYAQAASSSRGVSTASGIGDDAYSDGELGPADEDEADDSDDGAELGFSRPGKRTFDSLALHPNGVENWMHAPNCVACMTYLCPCLKPCLGKVREHHGDGAVTAIYDFRSQFRAKAKRLQSGLTDTLHMDLKAHFDASTKTFVSGFVVAAVGGLCEKAYCVALGLGEATICRARADVTTGRVLRKARRPEKLRRLSLHRSTLDAWVLAQRNTFEGDKYNGKKWYTEKATEKSLWDRYCLDCSRLNQPTQGTSRLLHTIWKEHTEIKEVAPTGHDICDVCGLLRSKRVQLDGLTDAESKKVRDALDEQKAAHDAFHAKERKSYDACVNRAVTDPSALTTLTIDAPTRHQFDVPTQPRDRRDTIKKFDGAVRWQSKLEGVLDAGLGMNMYIARSALGSGANLVCTALMLSLMNHVEIGRPLGRCLRLQLDNTTSENKCRTVLGLCAWLVHKKHFIQVSLLPSFRGEEGGEQGQGCGSFPPPPVFWPTRALRALHLHSPKTPTLCARRSQ